MLRVLADWIGASLFARSVCFGLVYFASAELGHALSFRDEEQAFATFWPPAGLFVASLALTRISSWPAIILAAWCANLASNGLFHHNELPVNLGFCFANTMSACLGAWLFR